MQNGSVSFAVSAGRRLIDRYVERVGADFHILFVDPGEELPLEIDVDPPHLILKSVNCSCWCHLLVPEGKADISSYSFGIKYNIRR